jgi:hypothetical protein
MEFCPRFLFGPWGMGFGHSSIPMQVGLDVSRMISSY